MTNDEAIKEFVRSFALADAPKGAREWSVDYLRGYSTAVRELVAEAGLDQDEIQEASRQRNAAKFVL